MPEERRAAAVARASRVVRATPQLSELARRLLGPPTSNGAHSLLPGRRRSAAGRPIAHPAAWSLCVVALISAGFQLSDEDHAAELSGADPREKRRLRRSGECARRSSRRRRCPAGAAAGAARTSAARLGASQRRSRRTPDPEACRRVEEVEAAGSTGSRRRCADARGGLRVDARRERSRGRLGSKTSSSPAASRTSLTSTGGASTRKMTCASAPRSSTTVHRRRRSAAATGRRTRHPRTPRAGSRRSVAAPRVRAALSGIR